MKLFSWIFKKEQRAPEKQTPDINAVLDRVIERRGGVLKDLAEYDRKHEKADSIH